MFEEEDSGLYKDPSYEEHKADLVDCILKGGTIWKDDGSQKITHKDFREFAESEFVFSTTNVNRLIDSWLDEEETSTVNMIESLLNDMSDLVETFLNLSVVNPEGLREWSTMQMEGFDDV